MLRAFCWFHASAISLIGCTGRSDSGFPDTLPPMLEFSLLSFYWLLRPTSSTAAALSISRSRPLRQPYFTLRRPILLLFIDGAARKDRRDSYRLAYLASLATRLQLRLGASARYFLRAISPAASPCIRRARLFIRRTRIYTPRMQQLSSSHRPLQVLNDIVCARCSAMILALRHPAGR